MSKLTTCAIAVAFLAIAALPGFGQGNQRKRAVSKARGKEIVRDYHQLAALKARTAAAYKRVDAWIHRNWWDHGGTEIFRQQRQRKYTLKRRLDVIRDRMHLLKAEYYGVRGGWAAPMSKDEVYTASPRCPRCRQRTSLGRCYNPRCSGHRSVTVKPSIKSPPSIKSKPPSRTTTKPKSSSKPCPICGMTILCPH